ncbi:MAG: hypothetical protein SF066_21350 [Thermoanaerobaculia bacterium]|nr:hypothetical protein [Thermoanaerobaculia bacterium]
MASRVSLRFVLGIVILVMSQPGAAQPVIEAVAKRFVATATPAGGASPVALTPDGRYLLFHDKAPDVVIGQQDANVIEDVFVLDRMGISFPPVPPGPVETRCPASCRATRTASRTFSSSIASPGGTS